MPLQYKSGCYKTEGLYRSGITIYNTVVPYKYNIE